MSFLSRLSSRPDKRGGRSHAGRRADAGYDDDDYAPDDYQQDDDNWSPDEYFSPEGIKGRWAAGARPGERPGGRGRRDPRDSREAGAGYGGSGYGESGYSRSGHGGADRFDGGRFDGGPQRARGPADGYGRNGRQHDSYRQQESYRQDDSYGTDGYGTDGYGTAAYEAPERDGDRGER